MMKDAFRLKATNFLEKIGIEMVLGDRVSSFENNVVSLASGKRIEGCDMHIVAHTLGGNGRAFMPTDSLDNNAFIKVHDTFKVHGLDNVFAFGDW
jgi:NADH dehydrogenase FAD-containing subunit